MAVFDLEFTLHVPDVPDLEDRVDVFYDSLLENFAIVSADLAFNLPKLEVKVLLGVKVEDSFDSPVDLARDIATDAISVATQKAQMDQP